MNRILTILFLLLSTNIYSQCLGLQTGNPGGLFPAPTIVNGVPTYPPNQNLCFSNVQNYRVSIIPCNDTYFYVPNSFTPNFDGVNDIFFPKGENYTDLEILIYNRWGQLIFQSNNQGWDGTYSSNSNYLAPDGVYCYIIHYRDLENVLQRRVGSVTLLR